MFSLYKDEANQEDQSMVLTIGVWITNGAKFVWSTGEYVGISGGVKFKIGEQENCVSLYIYWFDHGILAKTKNLESWEIFHSRVGSEKLFYLTWKERKFWRER